MQVYNDELYHYGKLGMKWGHRKTYGSSPRMITAKRQLIADKKTLNKINNENHHISVGLTKKRQAAYDERDKAKLEKRIVKNESKLNKKDERIGAIKSAVKTYSKEFDKALDMSDAADKQWDIAKEAYKKTGKTRVSAIINNFKNKSPEVKAYSREFDKALEISNAADKQWDIAKEAYKKTGKTRVSAIINNFKYQ